jgi:hypothetical protein
METVTATTKEEEEGTDTEVAAEEDLSGYRNHSLGGQRGASPPP